MNEKPILFSTEMVKAVIAGRMLDGREWNEFPEGLI